MSSPPPSLTKSRLLRGELDNVEYGTEFDRNGEEAKMNRKATQTLSLSSKINSIHHVKSAKNYFEGEIQNSSDSKISYLLGTVDRPNGSKIEKFIEGKIKRNINIAVVEPTCLS